MKYSRSFTDCLIMHGGTLKWWLGMKSPCSHYELVHTLFRHECNAGGAPVGSFFSNIISNITGIDWQGPAVFAIIALAVLALFQKWRIVLLTLLTVVLGWGAEDMMLLNVDTNQKIVSVSLLVYVVGGIYVIILALFEFMNTTVKK